ncbi:hypothetical protein ACSBR1_030594 [Camellia fascicularis]
MMHVAADPSGIERNEVSQVLHDAAAAGLSRVMTRLNTITRIAYKGDETIMAWELMNEPRCQSDYSGRTINGWVEEMAACVKSIDNQHLLEIGMEGFYGDSMPERKQVNPGYQVGTDFISSNLIKDTDFTTIHAYPDIWLSGQNENSQMPFMQKWVENHWADWGKITLITWQEMEALLESKTASLCRDHQGVLLAVSSEETITWERVPTSQDKLRLS